jgi:hypothetical protein
MAAPKWTFALTNERVIPLIMEVDVRCSRHAGADLGYRCQLFAGHEREHAALLPGSASCTLVLWSSGGDDIRPVGSESAVGRPWAPGFPRIENAARTHPPELHGLTSPPELESTPPRGRLHPVDSAGFDRPA